MFAEVGILGIVKSVGAGEVRKGEGTLASPVGGATMQAGAMDYGRRKRPLSTQPYPRPYGMEPLLKPVGKFRGDSCPL